MGAFHRSSARKHGRCRATRGFSARRPKCSIRSRMAHSIQSHAYKRFTKYLGHTCPEKLGRPGVAFLIHPAILLHIPIRGGMFDELSAQHPCAYVPGRRRIFDELQSRPTQVMVSLPRTISASPDIYLIDAATFEHRTHRGPTPNSVHSRVHGEGGGKGVEDERA